jgi:hypothetical protein
LFERVAKEWWVRNVNLLSGMVAGELLTSFESVNLVLKYSVPRNAASIHT